MRRTAAGGVVLLLVCLLTTACGNIRPTPQGIEDTPETSPPATEPAPAPSPSASPSPTPSASPTKIRTTTPPPSGTTAPPSAAARPALDAPGPAGSRRGTGNSGVALTFDDGPDPVNTPALLDLLKQHGVKATFCVVGFRARDYPQVVARIAAEGHTLCNHSWQHLDTLPNRDDDYLRWDLKSTNEAILAAAPGAKIQYFRSPYGKFTPRVVAFAAELGMTPIYWDVDDQCFLTDKYGTGPGMISHMTREVQRDTRPGSIILSHENKKPHTVTAYRTILPWLKANYTLVAL